MISLPCTPVRPDSFCMGPIAMTMTIEDWIEEEAEVFNDIWGCVMRYLHGDWGNIDPGDWNLNIDTIKYRTPAGRLMGSYELSDGRTIWIITDGYGRQSEGVECCYTTILSPDDY